MSSPNRVHSQRDAAEAVAQFVSSMVVLEKSDSRDGYSHMGATLTDTILQAGLNYRSVVLPRVQRVLNLYPDAKTTTAFWNLFCNLGPREVIRWSHPEKIGRLGRLLEFLRGKELETESDLARWLRSPLSVNELLSINGIGPKTVDYLKILVGIPTVAVDRHVISLLRSVGFAATEYDECREIICKAAELLGIEAHILDGVIWQLMSAPGESSSS